MEKEMSEYITDPELLAQLNGGAPAEEEKKKDEYVTDPALLAHLNASTTGPVAPDEGEIAGAIAPSVIGMSSGPSGMKELGAAAKAGVMPYVKTAGEGLSKTLDIYKARPLVAPLVDAAGVMTMGVPPIAASQQALGLYDKLNAAKEGVMGVSQELSKGEQTQEAYNAMQRALKQTDPALAKTISETYGTKTGGAGNNAVRALLNSAEGKAAMSASPEFASAASTYLKAVPTYGEQVGKVVSPALKAAGKVLGPAGMAMNLYDAGQMARETDLGGRLARGEGQRAQQGFNSLLSRPTPAPLNPTEASNLLQSDDERTINIYGGRANLEALVKSGLRQKAASKVLGPVAPQ
jgi:hypothetical protein